MLKVFGIEEAIERIKKEYDSSNLMTERIPVYKGFNRVLGEALMSQCDVPHFRRSTVDGYAVRYQDLIGAGDSMPAFLDLIGEVEMGSGTDLHVESGMAVYVPTGGMVPDGADTVLMLEYVEVMDNDSIAVYKSSGAHENIIQIGDDMQVGDRLFEKGHRLRSQDLGALTAVGISDIIVYKKPKVAVLSTGDEILSPGEQLVGGKVRDINSYTISAEVERLGGEVVYREVIGDDYARLKKTAEGVLSMVDLMVISGGSSVGKKDLTLDVIQALGDPGVFIHGLAIKPGKPSIFSKAHGKPIIGLPGQPVSALIVFKIFGEIIINQLYGCSVPRKSYIIGELADNLRSAPGKETYQMVSVVEHDRGIRVEPIYGKSGMISLISKADGFIRIQREKEGLNAGEMVKIYLF